MITLAPLEIGQYETVARWLSNPEINTWLSGEWRQRETTSSVVAIAVRNRRNRLFAVCLSGEPCGLVAFSDIDLLDKTAMVWYLLGEQVLSGKGVMTGAVTKLIHIAFSEMRLECIYAWAIESNVASIRVLTKAGFRHAGRLRRAANTRGQQMDRLYFDITLCDTVT